VDSSASDPGARGTELAAPDRRGGALTAAGAVGRGTEPAAPDDAGAVGGGTEAGRA
jgi:hypothetical protein